MEKGSDLLFLQTELNHPKLETYKGTQAIVAQDGTEWRQWLQENHRVESSVWLILYRKESGVPSVLYPEAVDEALCFGWIDSLPNKRDDQSYYLFFSRRNPKSKWSKVNKDKVARLLELGRMEKAGLDMVETAKQNGAWVALDEVENLILPEDLKAALEGRPTAYQNWEAFPKSAKRGILEWILNAKTAPTREKRILETVTLAEKNQRANQYNPKK